MVSYYLSGRDNSEREPRRMGVHGFRDLRLILLSRRLAVGSRSESQRSWLTDVVRRQCLLDAAC
jgi:hypothetical protein